MDDLIRLRQEINEIDQELFNLLQKRFELSNKVKTAKKTTNRPIYDPRREEAILKSIPATSYQGQIQSLYQTLFALSKEIQSKD